nr:methionine gamma-lyase [uncultured Moellerella sp.]
MLKDKRLSFETRVIHGHYSSSDHHNSLIPPVYRTSTFTFSTVENAAACFSGEEEGYLYTRINNPTLSLLEKRIADLENAEAGIVFSSGMGAITSTCWTLLNPGDELLVDMTIYGCTYAFFHHGLERFGVKVRHIDLSDREQLLAAVNSNTKMIFFESPANPNMRIADIQAISQVAKQHGALVVVDNTYCTPYIQQPISLGADIVIHSLTKYMNGHGDVIAGAVATSNELATQIRLVGLKDMTGACLSPEDAFLIIRGLKTLPIRLDRATENAQKVAEYLAEHPKVEKVLYPGLPSFPQYELGRRQMKSSGAMIAFEIKGGLEAGRMFLNRLELFSRAVSLGDSESLAQHPASMTHSTYTPEERLHHGISDSLIRLAIGLEAVDDLIADLDQAFDF